VTDKVLQRLEAGALSDLVDLASDHVLDQPLHSLVDADWLSERIVDGMETWARSDQTEAWIRDRMSDLRERTPEGSLRDQIPTEVSSPLTDMVQRPFVPDRAIIGRLLGHRAVESLVRELLVGTLQSFAQRLKPSVPSGSRLRKLKRVGDGVLGGLGQVLEGQAEARVREFVDAAMSQVMNQIADHVCNPNNADAFGRFRGHLLEQVLDTPMVELDRELEKLDPDDLVATGTAIARSLVARDGLKDEIKSIIEALLTEAGDAPLRDHLADAGVADEWHTEVRVKLTQSAVSFTQTEGFRQWLHGVVAQD
jgi:hypothetical protein